MDSHIKDDVLKVPYLHRNQFAYQTKKSCDLTIHEITNRAERAVAEKEILLESFLNIEDVFHKTTYSSRYRW